MFTLPTLRLYGRSFSPLEQLIISRPGLRASLHPAMQTAATLSGTSQGLPQDAPAIEPISDARRDATKETSRLTGPGDLAASASTPPPPPRLRKIDFDSHAALRVVKGTFYSALAIGALGRFVRRGQGLWTVANIAFPAFAIREYIVTPVLSGQKWDVHRGVSRTQPQRPALLYLVLDSVLACQILLMFSTFRIAKFRFFSPALYIPLVGQLGVNATRIASWKIYHWRHPDAHQNAVLSSSAPASSVNPVDESKSSPSQDTPSIPHSPSSAASGSNAEINSSQPSSASLQSRSPEPSLTLLSSLPTNAPPDTDGTGDLPSAEPRQATIPSEPDLPPHMSAWRRAWQATRRTLHV